jgi:pimeloyl-ACP methyl ester carboxylesterase
MKRIVLAGLGLALVLAGCTSTPASDTSSAASSSATSTSAAATNRAVVLVSGGGLRTPFTTPTEACKDGDGFLAAGNTNTALRAFLLEQGKQVYTAPAMDDWGPVQEPAADSLGPFSECPPQLPESMTILTTGDLNNGGERLARFINYLNTEYGVTDVDLVGHSNGGLWSRAAIRVLKETGSPVKVHSLTTLGTPYTGAIPPRYSTGEIDLAACMGQEFCENTVEAWGDLLKESDKGLNAQDTVRFLSGPDGWNAAQGNALEGIPVTLLAGTYFTDPGGDPTLWPYDGTVPRYSALAMDVSDEIIPWRACWEAPLVHWIGQAVALEQPVTLSITDNPEALARVNQAIDESDTALEQPNRQGC